MITGELKSKINMLWERFWTGGITNPLTVIEQISYLIFIKMISMSDERNEKKSRRMQTDFVSMFSENKQHLKWKNLVNISKGDELIKIIRDEVFPFLKSDVVGQKSLGKFLKNAQFMIQNGSLLISAVEAVDKLPLEHNDTKGDLYEYLLSKLTTAGVAGQFRTPRHIIKMMVELADVKPNDFVCDPACGTAGFLVGVMEYLKVKYSSPEHIYEETDSDGKKYKIYPGDLLIDYHDHIFNGMFTGFDFDATMLRIAAMNLLLHGIENPHIENQDTLNNSFSERYPKQSKNCFDVILANPPFTGSVDISSVDSSIKSIVKTKKTELLFLVLMERILKIGGRCAVIVPDGVLFGASKAHQTVRKMIIDDNQLEAVISLPSGVFKPYAGVSTAILFFKKAGVTDNVWFYDLLNDGFSLDDKRAPVKGEELTDVVAKFHSRDASKDSKRIKHFFIPVDEIRKNKYDLSINRYKEIEYEEVVYDEPPVILARVMQLDKEITDGIKELEEMLIK